MTTLRLLPSAQQTDSDAHAAHLRSSHALPIQGEAPAEVRPVAGENEDDVFDSEVPQVAEVYIPPRLPGELVDTIQLAAHLFDAMKGGVWGLGTDEESVFNALRHLTPEQLADLESHYQKHFGRDLRADIQGELRGSDWRRASALLRGDFPKATAVALHAAMKGWGTDEAALFRGLHRAAFLGKIPEVAAAYEEHTGVTLEAAVRKELGGLDLERGLALLDGDPVAGDAVAIRKLVLSRKLNKSRRERVLALAQANGPALSRAYERMYGEDLTKALTDKLGSRHRIKPLALLSGNHALFQAVVIHEGLQGGGRALKRAHALLDLLDAETRERVSLQYQSHYGLSLTASVDEHLDGLKRSLTHKLITTGDISDAERLQYAMDGAGTDEPTIKRVLSDRTKDEIASIAAEYERNTGESLSAAIRREVHGIDRFEVEQLLLGKPESLEEMVERVQARHDYERSGISNAPAKAILDYLLGSPHGKQLDQTVGSLERALGVALEDGVLSAEERVTLEHLAAYARDDAELYRDFRETVGEHAATAGATIATTGASILTGGAGAPLLVSLVSAAAAGAAGRTSIHAALLGKSYSGQDAWIDLGLGAVQGAASVVALKAGQLVTRESMHAVSSQLLKVWNVPVEKQTQAMVELTADWLVNYNAASRAAYSAVQGGITGGVSSSIRNAAKAAFNEDTWREGIPEGLGSVIRTGLEAFRSGFYTGGTVAALISLSGQAAQLDLLSEENKDLVREIHVKTQNGEPLSLRTLGNLTAAEEANIQKSLQKLYDVTGGKGLEGINRIYAIELPQGQGTVTIGMAGGGDSIALSPLILSNPHQTADTLFHEAGHVHDFSIGNILHSVSKHGGSPFGSGEFISEYAKTTPWEDFAETHASLIMNWEKILADPDKYIFSNGSLGDKYAYILQHAYPDVAERLSNELGRELIP